MVKVCAILGSVALFGIAPPAIAQQPDAPAIAPTTTESAVETTASSPEARPKAPPASAEQPATYSSEAAPKPASAEPVPPGPPNSVSAAPDYYVGRSDSYEPRTFAPEQPEPADMPDFSIRVDPLNWLLAGRLGFELETEAWKFITAEVVPVFVVDKQPPLLNLGSIPDTLHQESNGFGALAGASIGAGFWLGGTPFRGMVLRLYYSNYGYKYVAKDRDGIIDSTNHTERLIVGMLGSHSKWGPFTIATGIGIGVETNREKRCIVDGNPTTKGCTDNEIVMRVQRPTGASDGAFSTISGGFHPIYLLGRISLGFVL